MVQKRPLVVDKTVIEEALGNLPKQDRAAVEEAAKTFPETDILKRVGRDMTLMEAARSFIGTVGVDKEGRVVSVPAVKRVTKEGVPIPSKQLEQRQQKVPYRGLDIRTAASQLQQVLGLPVVDENLIPTQNFLNLLQEQGDRPLYDVIQDVGTGRLGKERVRGVTEAMVAPKRQVITEKEFAGDKEAALSQDLRNRYYLRHRDNPEFKFGEEYTAKDWVTDFDKRISAIAEKQYKERVPYPTAPKGRRLSARAQYSLDVKQRNWQKERIEAKTNAFQQAVRRYWREDKLPREVRGLIRFDTPTEDRPIAPSLKDHLSDVFAAGRDMSREGTPLKAPEFGVMETMPPNIKRLMGESIPMRPDEKDLPPGQAQPTFGSLFQLYDRVEPATDVAEKQFALDEVLEWGRQTGLIKEAIDRASAAGTGDYVPYLES